MTVYKCDICTHEETTLCTVCSHNPTYKNWFDKKKKPKPIPKNTERDKLILEQRKKGQNYLQLAQQFNLSKFRIREIIQQ